MTAPVLPSYAFKPIVVSQSWAAPGLPQHLKAFFLPPPGNDPWESSSITALSGSLEAEAHLLISGLVASDVSMTLASGLEAPCPSFPPGLHLGGPGRRGFLRLIGKPRQASPAS